MVSLPLLALKLVQSGVPNYTTRAFGCASFLLVVVIVLFAVARKIGGWGPGHLSPRAQRRVARGLGPRRGPLRRPEQRCGRCRPTHHRRSGLTAAGGTRWHLDPTAHPPEARLTHGPRTPSARRRDAGRSAGLRAGGCHGVGASLAVIVSGLV